MAKESKETMEPSSVPSFKGAVMKKGLGTVSRISHPVDGNKPIMQEKEDMELEEMQHEIEESSGSEQDLEEIKKKYRALLGG